MPTKDYIRRCDECHANDTCTKDIKRDSIECTVVLMAYNDDVAQKRRAISEALELEPIMGG